MCAVCRHVYDICHAMHHIHHPPTHTRHPPAQSKSGGVCMGRRGQGILNASPYDDTNRVHGCASAPVTSLHVCCMYVVCCMYDVIVLYHSMTSMYVYIQSVYRPTHPYSISHHIHYVQSLRHMSHDAHIVPLRPVHTPASIRGCHAPRSWLIRDQCMSRIVQ
jgi:hypothetical protein